MYATIAKESLPQPSPHTSASAPPDCDCSEGELNSLGYELLYSDHNPAAAIEIFRMNTVAFPASSNAFDSLAEAYPVNGDKALRSQLPARPRA
jgi:hypothetical protein